MGVGAPLKIEDCEWLENAHRTDAPRTRYRCKSSCATALGNTLRVCALRAMSAAGGGHYGAFLPANCSVLNGLVDTDRG